MTEKERKAVEYIDKIISGCENEWKQRGYKCDLYEMDEPIPVEHYKTLISLIQKQEAENKKKDKIIDFMVEMIDEYSECYARYGGKPPVCNENCIKNAEIDCKNCIKQYFERKAEEE